MAVTERESLFSLEVVVDELSIPGITCRYPAVAVRLMDFPTLMVHHADARMIRKIQLNLQQKGEIPRQFIELLDEHENFQIQKGKSCLFKFSAKNLRMHLSNTPMYILVVDTFPEIPRLIASCVVPLCQSMENLYEHISCVGLAIPQTDGHRGQYVLRNLMGVNVGHVVFGYRLISLGEGLLQHIPNEALVVSKPEQEKVEETKDPDMIPERDIPKAESAKPERPNRLSKLRRSKPEVLEITRVQHIFNESVLNLEFQNEGTQTDPPKTSRGVVTDETEEVELLYRPPPLYFSSNAEERIVKPVEPTCVSFDYVEETISEADEPELDEPVGLVYRKPEPVQLPRAGMQYADMQQNLAQFPVLRALFDEINRLQGVAIQSPRSAFHQISPRAKPKPKVNLSPPKVQKPIGKENRDDFLIRMAQPKMRQEKPPVVRGPQEAVFKNKSWIRKEPAIGQKKTRLQYGMTNTQRLRLAMNNPQMLKELEGEKPRSPIAQKLLENLATLGKTRVLAGSPKPPTERPVPTPRKHPPVRHSFELEKGDHSEEESAHDSSECPDEESSALSPISVGERPRPNERPSVIHIPIAGLNESDALDPMASPFPDFSEENHEDPRSGKDGSDPAMKIPVINPKASKNSPISSLRTSQAFTAHTGEVDHPSLKPWLSVDNARAKTTVRTAKNVSFDGDESTATKVSSEYEPSERPVLRRAPVSLDSLNTDSLSSYAPTEGNHEAEHSEYSDDFEVDIPTSPTHRPSLPKVDHMGYTL